jgi:ABC-type transport system involved in multi-copper enzyme maturation permease subunit
MLNVPAPVSAIAWLVRETFRQSTSTRLFWLMLGVSALCVAFCLGARIDGGSPLRPAGEIELFGGDGKPLAGINPKPGSLSLGFGAVRLNLFRDGRSEVHFLQVLLAKWVAGAAGTVLALIWTAGFLPEFLHPDAASVLLVKPVPRWSLLVGKCLGVLAFVAFHATLFVSGTWLALGLRTGVWEPGYLLTIPLLLLNFAIAYGASSVLAACTRNATACVFGAILFWLVCFGMNYGRHAVVALPELAKGTAVARDELHLAAELGYWVLPKPADLTVLLDHALQAGDHFRTQPEFATVERLRAFHPWLSVLSSLAFTAAMLAIAARQFAETDY